MTFQCERRKYAKYGWQEVQPILFQENRGVRWVNLDDGEGEEIDAHPFSAEDASISGEVVALFEGSKQESDRDEIFPIDREPAAFERRQVAFFTTEKVAEEYNRRLRVEYNEEPPLYNHLRVLAADEGGRAVTALATLALFLLEKPEDVLTQQRLVVTALAYRTLEARFGVVADKLSLVNEGERFVASTVQNGREVKLAIYPDGRVSAI